jgi:hypothetical protein
MSVRVKERVAMSGLSSRIFRFQIVALGVVALTIGGITLAALGSTESAWVVVNADKEFDEHVSLDEELGVYVVTRGSRTLALYNRGPYEDELVEYCPSSQLFETMRSGAKFDVYGRFFFGPVARGMSRYQTRVHDGELEVYTAELIPGPSRKSTAGEALQPVGRYCVGNLRWR